MALPNNPTPAELVKAVKDLEQGGGGGSATDVQVDDVSQVVSGVANLKTKNGNYNANTNKLATEDDLPTLYSSTGANTDGAMTQASSTTELNKKVEFIESSVAGAVPSNYYTKSEVDAIIQAIPTEPQWTTIYDKDSEDSSLNLGYTSGLLGNVTLENFPDLSSFSKLRVWTYGASNDGFYDFELDDKVNTRTHSIIFANSSGTTLYVYGFITKAVGNTFVIAKTNNFIRLYFVNGKTSTVTDYSQNSLYYIRKIEAC